MLELLLWSTSKSSNETQNNLHNLLGCDSCGCYNIWLVRRIPKQFKEPLKKQMSFNSQNPLGESDHLLKLFTYLECEYVNPQKVYHYS